MHNLAWKKKWTTELWVTLGAETVKWDLIVELAIWPVHLWKQKMYPQVYCDNSLISIKWNCHWKHGSHTRCTVSFSFLPSLFYMTPSHTKNRTALALLLPWYFSSHVIGKMDGSELGMNKLLEMDRTIFFVAMVMSFEAELQHLLLCGSFRRGHRSHEFCCNIWVVGRSVFMTIASLFALQWKESIFGPSWEHPFSWNGADGPKLFNRCLAHPRLGCIISKVTSGTHTAEWDVQHNTGFYSPIRIQTIHIPIFSSAIGSGIYMLKFLRLKKVTILLSKQYCSSKKHTGHK